MYECIGLRHMNTESLILQLKHTYEAKIVQTGALKLSYLNSFLQISEARRR
jgi:hypothetical protein